MITVRSHTRIRITWICAIGTINTVGMDYNFFCDICWLVVIDIVQLRKMRTSHITGTAIDVEFTGLRSVWDLLTGGTDLQRWPGVDGGEVRSGTKQLRLTPTWRPLTAVLERLGKDRCSKYQLWNLNKRKFERNQDCRKWGPPYLSSNTTLKVLPDFLYAR